MASNLVTNGYYRLLTLTNGYHGLLETVAGDTRGSALDGFNLQTRVPLFSHGVSGVIFLYVRAGLPPPEQRRKGMEGRC
jgi:hypothetical protein